MDDLLRIAHQPHSALPLDVLAALTLLSVAPFVLVLSTSFVRIVVVLSLVRSAIGAAMLPPNAVLTGLALVLTFVIMTPTFEALQRDAIHPYAAGTLSQSAFLDRASRPLRAFMLRQTKSRDVAVFARVAHRRPDEPAAEAPLTVLIPAFVVGELRSAFAIGVALYLPFVAIDLAARDEPVVDEQVHRTAGEAVELDDRARPELEDVADQHLARAQLRRHVQRHVHEEVEVLALLGHDHG